jgi:type III restriction enzyme
MSYLHEIFDNPFARKALSPVVVPDSIVYNLSYQIRPYQIEAFKRFVYTNTEEFEGKPSYPMHLLYNMATGSGKTLIMAGLILYLYEKGYRNFLFFVNSNNIIMKTKDNFLNSTSSKYLFSDNVTIDGKAVKIKEIKNFDEADKENINIKFTTINKLHGDLTNTKENSVTYEDFADRKIVLIADEAHHLSKATKQKEWFDDPSWEKTVSQVLNSNHENILLEFTATLDYESREIVEKYKDKVLYRYDLAEFRKDRYSKEINLARTDYEMKNRILQALILNLYRQELAANYNIELKPVILFKSKLIKTSHENKTNFHNLIDSLSSEMIDEITKSKVPVIKKAFAFFEKSKTSKAEIVRRLKEYFREENCISANNDVEAELNQIRLNTLEDNDNPIRAIFAVQKLNEGWDVLNLFDIVRLYEGRDGKAGKPGKTTISEAQLIGRGARYYPFKVEEDQDIYTRKYDNDVENDLKVLEELYYHAKEDSRYISEIKKALIETGIYEDDEDLIDKMLSLKPEFKETQFYKTGIVAYNEKIVRSYDKVKSFSDLNVALVNYEFTLSSGRCRVTTVFNEYVETEDKTTVSKDIPLNSIPYHVIRYALSTNSFFHYSNLVKYFPNVSSISGFMESNNYLSGLEITFSGIKDRIAEISNRDYLQACTKLLGDIEHDIKTNTTEYTGGEFLHKPIQLAFKDKKLRINNNDERAKGQEDLIKECPWYVYNANYGTSEEKAFLEMFARRFEYIEEKYENIYLIRNERALKIHDEKGRAFEPDFLLFCKQKDGDELILQVFIEPKGSHLKKHDNWKEDFLKTIRDNKKVVEILTDKYLITGISFYNASTENDFKKSFEDELDLH